MASIADTNGLCPVGKSKLGEHERRIGVMESKIDRMNWLLTTTLVSSICTLLFLILGKLTG